MEVHFAPELASKIDRIAAENGSAAEELSGSLWSATWTTTRGFDKG